MMKTITLLVTFLLLISFSFGQELKIKYDIKMKSSNPEMQSQMQMYEGSSLSIYAKDKASRIEMDIGGMMKTTTVINFDKGKGLIFIEGLLGQQAATFEGDNLDKYKEEEESDLEIELLKETKEILGYTCKKAVIYVEEEGAEITFWYTDEVNADDAYLMDNTKYGIPGIALEYVIEQPEITTHFLATTFETNADIQDELFNLEIPEGYTEKTYEEISNLGGQ